MYHTVLDQTVCVIGSTASTVLLLTTIHTVIVTHTNTCTLSGYQGLFTRMSNFLLTLAYKFMQVITRGAQECYCNCRLMVIEAFAW